MYSSLDTVWVLLCTALIFFMQAGFAMLETGFTRAKNAGNIIMKNLMDYCIGSVLFWVIGFSFLYGDSIGGFIGTPSLFAAGKFAAAGDLPQDGADNGRRAGKPQPYHLPYGKEPRVCPPYRRQCRNDAGAGILAGGGSVAGRDPCHRTGRAVGESRLPPRTSDVCCRCAAERQPCGTDLPVYGQRRADDPVLPESVPHPLRTGGNSTGAGL